MQKLKLAGLVAAAVITGGCGVNPDRLATMHENTASVAEGGADETVSDVEYSDGDPKAIRDAVMAIQDMKASVEAGNYEAYRQRRYDVVEVLQVEVTPEIRDHEKFPKLFNALRALDRKFVSPAGEGALALVESQRTPKAAPDALYAIADGFDACQRALDASDMNSAANFWRTYEGSLGRARSLDAASPGYVGKKANGVGLVDVPFEAAYCELVMGIRRAEAEDLPPPARDESTTYQDCGVYEFAIEATEVGSNRFGEFVIKTFMAQDPQPGPAEAVACEGIPANSDAPNSVVRVMKSGVRWWKDGDVVSMAGPFAYNPGADGKLVKSGKVRLYRKDATLKTSSCGEADAGVTCEADGSALARAYNHASHFLKRAEVHRRTGNGERCREMADRAYKALSSASVDAEAEKTFKTSGGEQMSHAQIVSRLEAMKSEANDALASDWCTKR